MILEQSCIYYWMVIVKKKKVIVKRLEHTAQSYTNPVYSVPLHHSL